MNPVVTEAANGLRLVEVPMEGTEMFALSVAFHAGARSERPEENGYAHFLEHLVFKGSPRYPSEQAIAQAAERLGAEMNAYTSHDFVNFYIAGRQSVLHPSADILLDMLARPLVPVADMETERGVVIQEISMYDDDPQAVADMLLERAAYGEHPLGRSVLGPAQYIRTVTREQILAFRARQWSPARGLVVAAGNLAALDRQRLLAQLQAFSPQDAPPGDLPLAVFERRVLCTQRDTNQSHLRLYWPLSVQALTERRRRLALGVLLQILGGGLASRLGHEIRVKRGLCYSIYANADLHADGGGLVIASGLQSDRCREAYDCILDIMRQTIAAGVSDDEVARAKASVATRIARRAEQAAAVGDAVVRSAMIFGEVFHPAEALALVDDLTRSEIDAIAGELAVADHSLACVGPHDPSDFA